MRQSLKRLLQPLIPSQISLIKFAALCVAATVSLASAQPGGGKGAKLPDSIKLEADIQYAGNTTPSQRLNLLLRKTPKGDKPDVGRRFVSHNPHRG
jgi:hypothetical protein